MFQRIVGVGLSVSVYLRKSCATVTHFVVSCATATISSSIKSVDCFDIMSLEIGCDAKKYVTHTPQTHSTTNEERKRINSGLGLAELAYLLDTTTYHSMHAGCSKRPKFIPSFDSIHESFLSS